MTTKNLQLTSNDILAGRYRLLRQLGSGGFSEVWLVHNIEADLEQALKIYRGINEEGIPVFRKEFSRVFKLNHPNILKATDFSLVEGVPYLVMPYCENGTIAKQKGTLEEQTLANVIYDISSALAYLHEAPLSLVHQDVKPDNFLISDQGRYLLADFGISAGFNSKTGKLKQSTAIFGQTPKAYRAPEFFSEEGYREAVFAADIWALGVAIFELATGYPPYGEMGGATLYINENPPLWPNKFSKHFRDIIQKCLSKDPWERPTAERLKNTAAHFLKHGNWQIDGSPEAEEEQTEASSIPFFAKKYASLKRKDGQVEINPYIQMRKRHVIIAVLGICVLTVLYYGWQQQSTQNMLELGLDSIDRRGDFQQHTPDTANTYDNAWSRKVWDEINSRPIEEEERIQNNQ